MINPNHLFAVLTGDLVGSSESPEQSTNRAFVVLEQAAKDVSRWQHSRIDTRFTRFRGDGWQIVVNDHWMALRVALIISARLRADKSAPATRIAIGYGSVDSIGTRDLADASGEAFVASGRAMDRMGKTQTLVANGSGLMLLHAAIVGLLEERMLRWTEPQAEAMALWLEPDNPTLAEIGKRLEISPQAVSYRLNGAGANAIQRALKDWEWEQESKLCGSLSEPQNGYTS